MAVINSNNYKSVTEEKKFDTSVEKKTLNEVAPVAPTPNAVLEQKEKSIDSKTNLPVQNISKPTVSVVEDEMSPEEKEFQRYEQAKNKKIKILFGIFMVFFVMFAGAYVYKTMQDKKPPLAPTIIPPTPIPYQHFRPSIYAKDKEVLSIEEELLILQRELATQLQKESNLDVPVLDYAVVYEEKKKR